MASIRKKCRNVALSLLAPSWARGTRRPIRGLTVSQSEARRMRSGGERIVTSHGPSLPVTPGNSRGPGGDNQLWLVQRDHVTWILISYWITGDPLCLPDSSDDRLWGHGQTHPGHHQLRHQGLCHVLVRRDHKQQHFPRYQECKSLLNTFNEEEELFGE